MKGLSGGARALLLAMSSAVVGGAYAFYLRTTEFPPDIARVVPILWLAGAVLAGVWAVRALGTHRNRLAAGLALVLAATSAVFAAVFLMAALMGD